MPASARRSVYLIETYWLPLSLWCTSPPRWTGRRSCSACSSASSTKLACAVREARDVGEVGEPQNVRPRCLELAVDVIQWAWRSLVAGRGLDGFAADNPLQTH